jgi:hypothetical protein
MWIKNYLLLITINIYYKLYYLLIIYKYIIIYI